MVASLGCFEPHLEDSFLFFLINELFVTATQLLDICVLLQLMHGTGLHSLVLNDVCLSDNLLFLAVTE